MPNFISSSSPRSVNTKVSVDDLVAGKSAAIDLLRRGFATRGWIFVQLPATIQRLASENFVQAQKFFQLPNSSMVPWTQGEMFGYQRATQKHSFRILTGSMLSDEPGADAMRLPQEIAAVSRALGAEFDKLCTEILKHTATPVFETTLVDLKLRKLPLALKTREDQKAVRVKVGGYGMLDTVLYDMTPRANGFPIVAEHVDPGLFSLTAGFTAPGLQMKDTPTGQWIDIPRDAAVCWTGIEATELTNGELEGGWHRIITPPGLKARMSTWYEVCVAGQVPKPIQTEGFVKGHTIPSETIDYHNDGEDVVLQMKLPVTKQSSRNAVGPAAPRLQAAGVEQFMGIPMSKIDVSFSKRAIENEIGIPPSKDAGMDFFAPLSAVGAKSSFEDEVGIPMSKTLDFNDIDPMEVEPSYPNASSRNASRPSSRNSSNSNAAGINSTTRKVTIKTQTGAEVHVDMQPQGPSPAHLLEEDIGIAISKSAPSRLPQQTPQMTLERISGIPMSKLGIELRRALQSDFSHYPRLITALHSLGKPGK